MQRDTCQYIKPFGKILLVVVHSNTTGMKIFIVCIEIGFMPYVRFVSSIAPGQHQMLLLTPALTRGLRLVTKSEILTTIEVSIIVTNGRQARMIAIDNVRFFSVKTIPTIISQHKVVILCCDYIEFF